MPTDQVELRNKTLYEAHECFVDHDFPFFLQGCDLKYEFEKQHSNYNRTIEQFLETCLADVAQFESVWYREEYEQFVLQELNDRLRKASMYQIDGVYFAFTQYEDYCKKRFSAVEERFNCLYLSGSLRRKNNMRGDFCTKRLFSQEHELFEYNLVLKYECLLMKAAKNVYIEPELKEKL